MIVDGLLRATLLLLVAGLPWCFGGVAPFFRLIVAGVLTTCLVVVLFRRRTVAAWIAVGGPLIVLASAVALGPAQLAPPVAEFARRWNPTGVEIRREFAASPAAASTADAGAPISLHPPSTRRDWAALCSAAAAFVLGAALFAETRALLLLMSTATAVGAAVAFFGLVQRLTWNGLIYWSEPTYGGQPFGPFICRNNAGGFLELTLAAAVGLLLWRLRTIPPADASSHDRRRQARSSFALRVAWFTAHLDAPLLYAAAVVPIISAGVLDSLSRGSFVAMTIGTVCALLLITLAARRAAFAWAAAAVVTVGLGLTAWLGQNADLYARLATLTDAASLEREPRLEHWQTSLQAARDFWLFGSGLGTYRYAYTRHQHAPTNVTFLFAENQYLDAIVSGGVVGLFLLLAALALLGWATFRLLRRARTAADLGIAATAALTLTTQVLHACFDFALYVPAHFVPFALFCGAFMRRASAQGDLSIPEAESGARPTFVARSLAMGFGIALTVCLGLGIDELRRADVCRRANDATRFADDGDPTRNTAWVDQAMQLERRAADACPDDGEVRIRLAELWIERYRTEYHREIGNLPVSPNVMLWGKIERLYADAHLWARTWNDAELEALRNHPLVTANLRPALAEARRARELCPLSPYPQLLVAKLCFLDESPLNDLFYLERLERLVGGRESWLYEIGALHLDAARPDRAFAAWRRCLEISPAHESQIVRFASGYLTPDQLLAKVLPDSPELIVRVARTYFTADEQRADRLHYLNHAAQRLALDPRPTAAECRLRGTIELELGHTAEAASWLERAITLDAAHADWHFEAASAFAELGQWSKAADFAEESVRLQPDNLTHQELFRRATQEAGKTGTNDLPGS